MAGEFQPTENYYLGNTAISQYIGEAAGDSADVPTEETELASTFMLDYYTGRSEVFGLIGEILETYPTLGQSLKPHAERLFQMSPSIQLDKVRKGLSVLLMEAAKKDEQGYTSQIESINQEAEVAAETAAREAAAKARAAVYEKRDASLLQAQAAAERREDEAIEALYDNHPGLKSWSTSPEGTVIINNVFSKAPDNVFERRRALEAAVFSPEFQPVQAEAQQQINSLATLAEELQQGTTEDQRQEIFARVIPAILAEERDEPVPDLSNDPYGLRFKELLGRSIDAGELSMDALEKFVDTCSPSPAPADSSTPREIGQATQQTSTSQNGEKLTRTRPNR